MTSFAKSFYQGVGGVVAGLTKVLCAGLTKGGETRWAGNATS